MRKGIVLFGAMIFVGFGTNLLIRWLRDGDFYIAEFITSIVGIAIILLGSFTKKNHKASEKPS